VQCLLIMIILLAIQFAGAFRFIYASVIILDLSRRAVTALDASAGARVSRHVGRALRMLLRAAFVVHVSVITLER
jgi:D-serine dehydratase